jgi:hypothetical protein
MNEPTNVPELRTSITEMEDRISEIQSTCDHTWTHDEPEYKVLEGEEYTWSTYFTRTCTTCALQQGRNYLDECVRCGYVPGKELPQNHPKFRTSVVAYRFNEADRDDDGFFPSYYAYFSTTCPNCGLSVVWREYDR